MSRKSLLHSRLIAVSALLLAMLLPMNAVSAQNTSPLCFTVRGGNVDIKFDIKNVTHTIQYSTDGVNWSTYTSNSVKTIGPGNSIYFRAESNQTTAVAFASMSEASHFYFTTSSISSVEASGNIMSLYGPDCPDLPLSSYAFSSMFSNCKMMVTAPELPATTLADYCYFQMFENCASLTTAPNLPATELADYCYNYMFSGCASLQTAPSLPATTLEKGCYFGMFGDCSSLTAAPVLPA